MAPPRARGGQPGSAYGSRNLRPLKPLAPTPSDDDDGQEGNNNYQRPGLKSGYVTCTNCRADPAARGKCDLKRPCGRCVELGKQSTCVDPLPMATLPLPIPEPPKQPPATPKKLSKRACGRCRSAKVKCDLQRPCGRCLKAGKKKDGQPVECKTPPLGIRKPDGQGKPRKKKPVPVDSEEDEDEDFEETGMKPLAGRRLRSEIPDSEDGFAEEFDDDQDEEEETARPRRQRKQPTRYEVSDAEDDDDNGDEYMPAAGRPSTTPAAGRMTFVPGLIAPPIPAPTQAAAAPVQAPTIHYQSSGRKYMGRFLKTLYNNSDLPQFVTAITFKNGDQNIHASGVLALLSQVLREDGSDTESDNEPEADHYDGLGDDEDLLQLELPVNIYTWLQREDYVPDPNARSVAAMRTFWRNTATMLKYKLMLVGNRWDRLPLKDIIELYMKLFSGCGNVEHVRIPQEWAGAYNESVHGDIFPKANGVEIDRG